MAIEVMVRATADTAYEAFVRVGCGRRSCRLKSVVSGVRGIYHTGHKILSVAMRSGQTTK